MSYITDNEAKITRYMSFGFGALIIGALLWIFAIKPYLEKADTVNYQPKGSVEKITYKKSDHSLGINGGNNNLASLVNVDYFYPLKPGDDPNVASQKLGEADRFRTEGDNTTQHQNAHREYELNGYTLKLTTYLTRYSDSDDDIFHVLESLPHGVSYYQVLKGDALSNIPSDIGEELKTITVDVNNDDYGAIQLNLVGDRVESMRWYENRPR